MPRNLDPHRGNARHTAALLAQAAALFCLLLAPVGLSAASGDPAGLDARPAAFTPIPGVREFSSRLIARPLQPEALAEEGLNAREIELSRAAAREEMSYYEVIHHVESTDDYVFRVPAGLTENDVARRLMETGLFQYVEPDWILYPVACPDDPQFGNQWHHQSNRMQSCAGWDIHTGSPSVGVGICDTGVLTTHEDLQLHRLEGYNAVDRLWETQGGNIGPVHPHGTNTTGCAAANGNNGVGVSGVGWDLSHRMLRVTNSPGGNAYLSDLQHAARTSIESGDRVASVSYSGADASSNLTTATYIKSIGGLLVWAAGNDGRYLSFGNRDADDLIVVGATNQSDGSAWFSAYGPFVDVTAPGTGVLTTDASSNSGYAAVDGTSFSTPLTAGLIGVIWSADATLTPDQVESYLKQGCDDLGAGGVDDTFGYGRINVFGSLSLVGGGGGGGGNPPVADFSGTPTSGTAPLSVSFTDLSTGTPTAWSWDFGDGGTSTAQNPAYTYNAAGTYTVTLTASNANGSDTMVRTNYVTVSGGGGGYTGEGFVLSRNPDFSTDDRTFTRGETIYMLVWSDRVDYTNMRKDQWELRDPNKNKIKQNLTNNLDNSHTAAFALSGLPSNATDWTWKGKVEDNNRNKYNPTAAIVVTAGGGTPPVADFVGSPTSGTAPLSVAFGDLSTGSPTSWSWDFGDGGTSTAQNPNHTYNAAGLYTVTMIATNGNGSDTRIRNNYISVTAPGNPPVADFSGTPTSGTAPLSVSFTDLSTGTPTAWSWDFGDGGTSTAQNPAYTYNAAGTYTVTLTATNAYGSDTMVRSNYISVTAPGNPPVADFSGTPTSGTAPLSVSFTDLSTGTPTAWSWDFGDGGTSTAQNPAYTYNAAGTYTVTLTASNANGSDTMVRTNYVTVSGGGGGYTGEGFILSRNPDFSTDDRTFTRGETIYMLVWSDRVDYTNMRKDQWELRDPNKNKIKQNLTNNFDNSHTASFALSGLPSNATDWRWKGKVEDNNRNKYRPTANIVVMP